MNNNNQDDIQEIEGDNQEPQYLQIEGERYELPSPPLLVRQYGMVHNNYQPNNDNDNEDEPQNVINQINNFRL